MGGPRQSSCLVVTLRIRYFNNSKFDGTGFNSGEPVIRNLFQQQQFVSIYLNLLEESHLRQHTEIIVKKCNVVFSGVCKPISCAGIIY